MKSNWLGSKANEVEEEIQAEVRELIEIISRSRSMKLTNNIVTMRKVEFLKKDNMEEEAIFSEEEEEEAPEEVNLDVMPMENQSTSLGNVLRERKEEEVKYTSLKHIIMWKQKQQKEEITS
jgi:hypothetical protein